MSAPRTLVGRAVLQLVLLGCASTGATPAADTHGIGAHASPGALAALLDSATCVSVSAASDGGALRSLPSVATRASSPRWRADSTRTLTVAIQDAPTLAGWTPAYRDEVVSALSSWEAPGSPLRFTLLNGPDDHADVTVHWIDRFRARYEGWTTVSWDHTGFLEHGDVSLALHSPDGQLLTPGERHQVAMHEIGHALGLSHSVDPASIMSPTVRVTAIAPVDFRTLRQLYGVADDSELALSAAQRAAVADSRCASPKA